MTSGLEKREDEERREHFLNTPFNFVKVECIHLSRQHSRHRHLFFPFHLKILSISKVQFFTHISTKKSICIEMFLRVIRRGGGSKGVSAYNIYLFYFRAIILS